MSTVIWIRCPHCLDLYRTHGEGRQRRHQKCPSKPVRSCARCDGLDRPGNRIGRTGVCRLCKEAT